MDDYGYETKIRRAAKIAKSIGVELLYSDKGETTSSFVLKGLVYKFKNKTSASDFIEAVESILTYKEYNVKHGMYNSLKARKSIKNLVSVKKEEK